MGWARATSMRTVMVLSRLSLTTTPVRTLRPAIDSAGVSATEALPLVRDGQEAGDLAPADADLARALERSGGVLEAQVEVRLPRLAQAPLQLVVPQLAELRGLHAATSSRSTNLHLMGSFWAARRMASRASGSGTPASSN